MVGLSARVVVRLAVLLLLLSGIAPASLAQDPADGVDVGGVAVLAPDASYGGATRGEWVARWWQRAVSVPEEINPSFDPTGERCGFGQYGPVSVLAGAFTTEPHDRTCVVAEGPAIYVRIVGMGCTTVEPPPFSGRTEAELRECVSANAEDILEDGLRINGEPVEGLDAYRRTASPLFTLTFAEGTVFGVPAGVAESVSASYSVIIAPPSPGAYEITGLTQLAGETEPFEATIHLVVQDAQVIEPEASPAASPEA